LYLHLWLLHPFWWRFHWEKWKWRSPLTTICSPFSAFDSNQIQFLGCVKNLELSFFKIWCVFSKLINFRFFPFYHFIFCIFFSGFHFLVN
jgi:hypothetical protein